MTFVDFFRKAVAARPHAVALACGDDKRTYAQLDARSDQIADALVKAGIGSGDIVPIFLPRGAEAVEAMVGVFKSGAALCVISSEYPADRVDFIRKDTSSKLLIDKAWLECVPDKPVEFTPPLMERDDPQLVVYTSGSTGNPKGVSLPRKALQNALRSVTLGQTAEDIFLSLASFSFVAVVVDVLLPLYLGATLHIADERMRRDPDAIAAYVKKHGITTTFMPPQLAARLIGHVEGYIKILLCGSERIRGLYSDKTRIINVYGCSETCSLVSYFPIDRRYDDSTPIGLPPEGVVLYLLDDGCRQVNAGETGEICVSGQIATCYLNLPELTADRFIPNPFAKGPDHATLFRTGDLGRFREDGTLEYVQRKDWMLKVRGNRVEPGEIETAMTRLSPVTQAVVTGFTNAAGETALYAVYTAPVNIPPQDVADAIKGFLPDYMMPAFLEQVDVLPLNANGKVDRKNIHAPDAARFKVEYIPPENEREKLICGAFEQLFKIERAGALDRFDLLGGDSISAARLQSMLPEPGLFVQDILIHKTPRALAALNGGTEDNITAAGHLDSYPLTFAERQMATEKELDPESVSYNVNMAIEINGPLNIIRLEEALRGLVARHAALRSYYVKEKGGFVHKITQDVPVRLELADCAACDVEASIKASNLPYDLSCAPLFRFTLYRTGGDNFALNLGFHHIIMDGASGSVVMDELWRLYRGETLPPLTLDYPDYAVWQNSHADTRGGEEFFRSMFADGVPENEMPTRPQRPDTLPFADTDIVHALRLASIDAAAKRLGVSAYSLLFSAAALTLAKYCGSEDVTLGAAMSGRDTAQVSGMVGMFVNTLAVRVKTPGDTRRDDFLRGVYRTIDQVKAHQSFPFEQLVSALAPDRNPSRSPVFDVIVNYLHELPTLRFDGLTVSPMPVKRQALATDMMLEFLRVGDDLRTVLSYSPELYSPEVAEGFLEQLICVIERICGEENQTLTDISELPEAHRRRILEDFAGRKCDRNLGKTVVDLFREQARKTPQNRAVKSGETVLTYTELDNLSDRLATALVQRGSAAGRIIGLLLHRSGNMPLCSLGVLKSGAAYLPLDPAYPADRLEFMLEDAGVELVIADRDLTDRIPGYTDKFLFIDELAGLPVPDRLPLAPAPNNTLIILYTSGTTGKPKGVMLTHGNLTNFCTYYQAEYALNETDNVPAYASFGFDANMMDTYPTLISGACLHIIPEEMRLDLPELNKYFIENGIGVAFLTTQLGRQFAESMKSHKLRALLVGGETLVPVEPPVGFSLYNVYGPTECTILTTRFLVDKLYDRVPIGRALDNTALYVVDKRGRLAPVGVAGELCIAGRQVAAGYLNRPDLNSEKFPENPFCNHADYSRIYRTGDVVRFLPDGCIDFVGRSDFQIKIRGFRVELTEIEARIRAYPGITDATVVAVDAPAGGKCAAAYFVSDNKVDTVELAAFIERELPSYMVPAAMARLDRIPLNQNGKVDRRKLPPPVFSTDDTEETARPLNDLEQKITEIAAGILGHSDFGITSNLLRSGLTSLSAIKLTAALDEAFGISPTVRELMADPTVLHIENIIIERLLSKSGETAVAAPVEPRASYPLLASQTGVYLDYLREPSATTYNVPFVLSLPSGIETAKLQKAVEAILDAHPAFKVYLGTDGDNAVQYIAGLPANVEVREMPESGLLALTREFVRPFDIFKAPLYRVLIVRTPERVAMLMDFHHIIFDGGSLDLLLRELGRVYGGGAPKTERLSLPQAALLEAQAGGTASREEDNAYFKRMLSEFEGVSELPADLPNSGRAGNLKETVRKADRQAVEAYCAAHGVTPAGVFLAASGYAISRWTQSNDVYISAVSSGRDDPRLLDSVGMFVRTIPLALKGQSGEIIEDYIRRTGQTLTDSISHSGCPYTRIAADYGYNPAIMYTCELGVIAGYTVNGQPVRFEGLQPDRPKFKLSIHVEERDGDMVFAVQYDDARYSKLLMETFADTLASALGGMLSLPDTLVSGLSLLTEKHARQIDGFNQTGDDSPETTLTSLFEQAAGLYPDRVALIDAEGEYTYAQLNAEANRLAHGLLSRGVGVETKIAFMLRRTGRILVTMLGVLKAGCAYIPLDPEYPGERIEYVLSDSDAAFLITTPDLMGSFANAVDVDALREGQSPENPGVAISPEQLSYIIYTSGSTGKPKGVMIEHRGIANYVAPHPRNIHVHALKSDANRMMSITTVAFDMFLKESMTTLCSGLTLVLPDEETAHDPVRLAALFEATGADAFNATPSLMMEYTEYPPLLAAIRRCKVIMAGAEKYPDALLSRLRGGAEKPARLFNTYGPTEITVSCNAKELTHASRVTVGAPLLNVAEQVADSDGNPLPPMMVGELLIGGRGLSRGYVGLSEQTAEKFIVLRGQRYYRSGDFARWTADGEIEILGRADNQIKLRGLRIELGEIEAAVASVDGVRACAVAIRKLQGADHICAYYLADRDIDPKEMRELLSRTLTGYMIPTAYLQIGVMPKTPNGKNDLRALPAPALLTAGEYVAPTGAAEEALCAVFADILGIERVGAEDNFFDTGGTSLAVTRVVIGAEQKGLTGADGRRISYADVFAHPTPRALAALLGESGGTGETPEIEPEYDYSAINAMLAENNLDAFRRGEMRGIGNVLLTGSTGFLGIHLLKTLLHQTDGRIVCLARRSAVSTAGGRLRTLLYYYFEDDVEWTDRITVIEGDMTDPSALDAAAELGIDTVFNCAANVSHFAKDSHTHDVNILGVKNLIAFCRKTGARLIQVSTASVSGFSVDGKPSPAVMMDETMLYFGQNLENQYVHSKFMAERVILEAAADGLEAKIMRVGNLMARNRDGEFQINAQANSFLGRLRAFHAVGCFPYSSYHLMTELAPIDSTTDAILRLAAAPAVCRVFHPYNNHYLFMGDIILTMKEMGIAVEMVEDDAFESALSSAMRDPARAERLTSLVAYQNAARGKAAVPVKTRNDYTIQALLRLGWRWPETDGDYLRRFLMGLVGLGIFGGDENV